MCRWTWKFYQRQVTRIIELLEDKIYSKGFKSDEEYIKVMERMGKPINPEKMPRRIEDFPYEVQMAFFIHDLLPEVWDGAGGNYFGKNWSALGTLLEVYEVENRKDVTLFLRYVDAYTINKRNKEISSKNKQLKNKPSGQVPVKLK